jgi:hypothetical protein
MKKKTIGRNREEVRLYLTTMTEVAEATLSWAKEIGAGFRCVKSVRPVAIGQEVAHRFDCSEGAIEPIGNDPDGTTWAYELVLVRRW